MIRRPGDDLFTKINQLSRDRTQRPKLQEELNKINIDDLCTVLSLNISRAGAAKILDSVLSATPDSTVISGRKFKIISSTLKCLREESISATLCSDIVTRILLDLTRLSTVSLVTLTDQSVQSITTDNDISMVWRDVLPECLAVLSQRGGSVVHCGTSMPVVEFKEQCLRALYQCEWAERILGQIVAMFNDVALSKNEHRQIVNKACSRIMLMAPDSLPPLLHQLLRLCSSQHLEVVLSYLNKYFNLKLYNKLNVTSENQQDSDATTFDIEDFGSHTTAELTESEGTCMYHLTHGGVNSESLRKVLRGWPSCALLASPFLLNLAFVLTETGPQYRDDCLAMVKSSIQLSVTDSFKTIDSAWLRSILVKPVNVRNLLKILLNKSATNKQLTTPGLLHLAFALLSTSPLLGREQLAHELWSFARLVLVRMAKSQPETSSTMVTMLGDRLAGDSTASRQYSETLLVLCQLTPLSIMDCAAQLQSVLENCILNNCEWLSSSLVLEAVQPMVKISPRVRDTLVMVCRKGLFSRDSSTRCLAVSGFLSLLRHLKLSSTGEVALSSQSSVYGGADSNSSYSHSYLTQISIDLHATQNGTGVSSHVHNQAVCYEIVSILRRCLTQDATVKQVMYTGLYDCVRYKTSLHGTILELLSEQLDRYLVRADGAEDSPIPIDFEKCVFISGADVKLVEPLGCLLYLIQQFLHVDSADQDMEDGEWSMTQGEQVSLKVKLKDLMETLAAKMARCTLLHFNLESDHGLGDLTPESQCKALKVHQTLASYEALMGYCISEWSTDSSNPADKLYSLYKAYAQILDHCKMTPKQKKALNKSLTKDDSKEGKGKSQKSQKAGQKSQTKNAAEKPKKQKAVLKLSNLTKDKAGPFKPLNCLWNLRTCSRAMKLLYGSTVSWSTSEQLMKIRTKRDLHRFVLRSLQTMLKDLGVLPGMFRLGKTAVQDLHRIAGLLYERCIVRFKDICEFDEMTALGCLECLRDCILLPLNPNLGLDITKYFQEMTKSSDSPLEQNISAMLEQIRAALESHDEEDSSSASEDDAMTRRLKEALVTPVPLLLEKVLPYRAKKGGGYQECKELTDVLHWYEDYFRTSEKASVALVKPLLAVASSRSQEWTLLEDVVAKLGQVLRKVDEDEDSHNESRASLGDTMPSVTDSNAGAVLVSVCQNLFTQCSLVDHALMRARALFVGSKLVTSEDRDKADKDLKDLERALVVQFCPLVSTVSALCSICVPSGAPCDRLLGLVARTYGLLAMLTKHLVARVGGDVEIVGAVRFEKLLKICGRKFSLSVDNLITYAESAGAEGKAKASRVLKDTRDIPKIVFETEQFSKFVIVLGKRCKMNLQQYLSHGTARDFRIQAPILKVALGKEGDEERQEDETVEQLEEEAVVSEMEDEAIVSEAEEPDAAGPDGDEPAQDDIDFNDADTTIITSGSEEENREEEPIQPKKKKRKM